MNLGIQQVGMAQIKSNLEEVDAYVEERMGYYENAVYTEDMITEASADRAKLNNLVKQINSERIAFTKEYDKPIAELKEQCDKIIAKINKGVSNIDSQVKGYEAKRTAAKRAELSNYWNDIAADLLENIPYEKIEVKTWLNKTTQVKKAKAEMDDVLQGIKNDLAVLKNLSSEDVDELTMFYFDTLSLQKTLQENEKRKARAAQIAKLKAERQAAEQRAAEERKAAEEVAERARAAEEQGETELPQSPYEPVSAQYKEPEPELITVAFKATGTAEQIKALKRFLVENGIKISKV